MKFPDIVNVKTHVGKEDGPPTIGFAGTSLTAADLPNVRAAGVTGLMPLFVFVKNKFQGIMSQICLVEGSVYLRNRALPVLWH